MQEAYALGRKKNDSREQKQTLIEQGLFNITEIMCVAVLF